VFPCFGCLTAAVCLPVGRAGREMAHKVRCNCAVALLLPGVQACVSPWCKPHHPSARTSCISKSCLCLSAHAALHVCFIIPSSHLAHEHFYSYFLCTSLFLLEISAVREGCSVTASCFRNFHARKRAKGTLGQGQCCIYSTRARVRCLQVGGAALTLPALTWH